MMAYERMPYPRKSAYECSTACHFDADQHRKR